MLKKRVITGLNFALILLMTITLFMTGCSYYATFSKKAFDCSLEYPRSWEVTPVWEHTDLICVRILGPVESEEETSVKVFLNIWLHPEGSAEQYAEYRLNSVMSSYSQERNFQLIRQETTQLDGCSGYLVEYVHEQISSESLLPSGEYPYDTFRTIIITIPRNNVVYEVYISASQNDWNACEKDIQHILDTFKWK